MNTAPYEALVEAAASLTDVEPIADLDEDDLSTAAAIVQQNRAALESARRALGPQCVVPLRYEESFYSEHCAHLSDLRNLALMFRAEAYVAAQNGDYRAVATIGLDIFELANAIRRGGLVTDLLFSITIAGLAIEPVRKNRTNFDLASRLLLVRDLRRLEAEREPFAGIIARDREWEVAVGYADTQCDLTSLELSGPLEESGLSEEESLELRQLLQRMVDLPVSAKEKMYLDQDRHVLALMRMLIIDLALREAYDSSGCFAEQLSSLAPGILSEMPLDPFTDLPFIYRLIGSTFHLYSTGPKMVDGGGKTGPWPLVAAGCADLYLDADDYWADS